MSSLFLRTLFLRILDGGTVALGMSPCAPEFASVARFVVEGEKRYSLRIAIDRFDGTIVGLQLKEVTE